MKFEKIANPLTIVAAFCSIAEIAAVSVMPKLSESLQGTFIWFVMLFPAGLLLCFFLTWNFNPRVLYSPSDFKDEVNFLRYVATKQQAERAKAIVDTAVENGEIDPDTAGEIKISLTEMLETLNSIFKHAEADMQKFDKLMVLLLSNEQGLSTKEVSEKLGYSTAHANQLLNDAVKQGFAKKEHTGTSCKYKWTWGNIA